MGVCLDTINYLMSFLSPGGQGTGGEGVGTPWGGEGGWREGKEVLPCQATSVSANGSL